MKLSLKIRHGKKDSRHITDILILINIGIFIGMLFLNEGLQSQIFNKYAFSLGGFLEGNYWNIITSMFLHGSIAHIILNMISLFFFGRALETEISKGKFLLIYFLGGIFASIFAVPFHGGETSIGASGAIFAIIAAAMIIKPFDFVAFPYVIPVPIMFVAIIMIISNLIFLVSPPEGSNISFASHVGGFLLGLYFGFREKGMKTSLKILIVGIIIVLLVSGYLQHLNVLDYTQFIQKVAS